MDYELLIQIIFGVTGGLGIFLLGMNNMSEGMQAIAGDKLRKLINAITNNRVLACGVGVLVTCIIQSSSVTTVMVVGMVNASIMTLTQAIGVILGANIGTTITGWILVLDVAKYGLPLLGISALFYLFAKNQKVRHIATLMLGLGMVFFGLELMKTGFAPLKELQGFQEWFSRFSPESYFGVIKCCLVGAVLTAIVQSSSATIGITMSLAFTGVIDYPTAAALVLGENIGTTITAYLASLGASTNAKRASYAHVFVNIIGVLWITAIFSIYTKAVVWFIGADPAAPVYTDAVVTYPHAMTAIAATHTGFNVINVTILLPFVGLLAKMLCKIVPDRKKKEVSHLTYIDVRMLETPVFAVEQSQKEVLKMGHTSRQMLNDLEAILCSDIPDRDKADTIFKRENDLDIVQKEIVEFLSHVMMGNISEDVVQMSRKQLRMADEYESVSDYITNILKLSLKMYDTEQKMTDGGLEEILNLHHNVADYLDFINNAVEHDDDLDDDFLQQAQRKGAAVTGLMKSCRSTHLSRLAENCATPLKCLIYTDMLNSYRRIKDHALNIAEVLAGEK